MNIETITEAILVALALSGAALAETRVNSAGSKNFDEADHALRDGQPANSAASVEKGMGSRAGRGSNRSRFS